MRTLFFTFMALLSLSLIGCKGGKNNGDDGFPENFNQLPDTAKVSYVMKIATPDSVARFICRAALGQIKDAKIESIGIATNYAYENYTGDNLDAFGTAYDGYVANLPLNEKMKIYALAGTEDPQGLGLQLGLEYLQSIRENNLSPDEVEKELQAFKTACVNDPKTYERFLKGFKTVLEADKNNDMPKGIYERFINYQ